MALTDKDLKAIKNLVDDSIEKNNGKMLEKVKDIVEYAIDKSETKLEDEINSLKGELKDFRDEMHREISDIAETNREFLAKLDNHEDRITKLEAKTA